MRAIKSGRQRELNVADRLRRRFVCWLLGHHVPGMACVRCGRRIYG